MIVKRMFCALCLIGAIGLTDSCATSHQKPLTPSTIHTVSGTITPAESTVVYGKDLTGNVVTFHLAPYTDDHLNQHPAPDIPNTRVTVILPLYPHAVSTNDSYPMTDIGYAMSPYVETSEAEFTLPSDIATAETWYKKTLETIGYKMFMSGGPNNSKTGEHSKSVAFASTSNRDLWVQLSFEQISGGKTFLKCGVSDILTPPRAADTKISGDVTRVDVTYKPNSQTRQSITRTIVNPQTISSWVTEINSLPRDARGMHGSFFNNGQADLVFATKDGKAFHVHIDPSGSSVIVNGGPGLLIGQLWEKVTLIMNPNPGMH